MRQIATILLVILVFSTTNSTAQGIQWDNLGVAVVTDFTGYTGSGFQVFPAAGELTSATYESTGMSDGSCLFNATCGTGDFARGASTGGESTGGYYAFTVETANVAFGIQPGGSDFTPGTVTYRIANFAGNVNDVSVSYDIWVYNDQPRANSLNVSWAVADTGPFTAVPAADFTTTEAADGSPAWVKTTVSFNVDLLSTLPQETEFYLRFESDDVSGSGGRDEIAIDNISTTPFASLAAELVSFTALADDSDLMLRWTTAAEENLSGFEIEAANSTGSFDNVGFVSASGAGSYEFRIRSSDDGQYRLKIVDTDGSFSYSATIELTAELASSFELDEAYPNPFASTATIKLRVRESQDVRVVLYDALGRQIETLLDSRMIEGESRLVTIDGTNLANGAYLYRIVGEKFSTSGQVTLVR